MGASNKASKSAKTAASSEPATQSLLESDDLKAAARRRRNDPGLSWGRVLRFVARLALGHPWLLAVAVVMTGFLAATTFFSLSLAVPILETLQGPGAGPSLGDQTPLGFLSPLFEGLDPLSTIRLVAILIVAGAVASGISLYAFSRVSQFLVIRIDQDLRERLYNAAMNSDMAYINRHKTANLFTLVHSFPGSATKIFTEYMKALQNIATFLTIAVTLLLTSWQLTLVAATIGLIVNLLVIQLGRLIQRFAYDIRESRLELHRQTMESLQAIKLIRLFARHDENREGFRTRISKHRRNQFKKASVDALVSPLQSALSNTFVAAVLFAATFVLADSTESWVPLAILFIIVAQRFQGQSGKFAKRRTAIAGEIPNMEAILDFLDDQERVRMMDGQKPFEGLRTGIRFEGVHFQYDAADGDVLAGIDLEIPRGKMVALVGGSGAGKSTIVDLVTRLYDPSKGRILVNGVDLREFSADSWRRKVAVVSQDSFLFNGTLRENIRFGNPLADDKAVLAAARVANAHEFISAMPAGYDTVAGERGVRLSGGQAQRIAIARAVLADPDLLILDEATSALDAATERLVQQALDKVSKNRTVIAVAHRLSTIQKADEIIVLENGRVVERGTHQALVAAAGPYANYVKMQDLVSGTMEAGGALGQWFDVTLARPVGGLAESILALPGVQAVWGRDKHLRVATDAAPERLVSLFAELRKRRHRVERIHVDVQRTGGAERAVAGGVRATRVLLGIDGDVGRAATVAAEQTGAKAVVEGPTGELLITLASPATTLPDLMRLCATRRVRVRTIAFPAE